MISLEMVMPKVVASSFKLRMQISFFPFSRSEILAFLLWSVTDTRLSDFYRASESQSVNTSAFAQRSPPPFTPYRECASGKALAFVERQRSHNPADYCDQHFGRGPSKGW
jgi:hypothetical protein